MLINNYDFVNQWDDGTSTVTTLPAEAGSFSITGGNATLIPPRTSEAQSSWYNSYWWNSPWYNIPVAGTDVSWYGLPDQKYLTLTAGQYDITGGTVTFSTLDPNITLELSAGAFVITGGDAKLSVPLKLEAGEFNITGGQATLNVEFTSTALIISTSSGAFPTNINVGTDIALNTDTDTGYTVVRYVDVDSLLLSGVFGPAPQSYKLLHYIDETTIPAKIELEFNGTEWVVIDKSPLGL